MKISKIFLLLIMGLFFIGYPVDEAVAQNRKDLTRKEKRKEKKNKVTTTKTKVVTTNTVTNRNNQPSRTRTLTEIRTVYNSNRNRKPISTRATAVRTVPTQARLVAYRGINYRYNNGVFYRPSGNSFVIARPPVGIGVTFLPSTRLQFIFGGRPYYYHDGVYYNQVRSNYYEVIAPPIGATISQLPPYSEDVWIDGQQYYISEGIFYKVVQDRNGRLVYEVVGYDS